MKLLRKLVLLFSLFMLCMYANYRQTDSFKEHVLEETSRNKVVKVTNKEGNSGGTGFFVKLPSGKKGILTNRHVCKMSKDGIVFIKTEYNERSLPVKIIEKSDNSTDLCLLEDVVGNDAFDLNNSMPKVGDRLFSLGHPELSPLKMVSGEFVGLSDVSVGIGLVESSDDCKELGQHVEQGLFDPYCVQDYHDEMLTNLKAFPGDSGSPVFNEEGKLVGVVFCSSEPTFDGNAINLDQIKSFLKPY